MSCVRSCIFRRITVSSGYSWRSLGCSHISPWICFVGSVFSKFPPILFGFEVFLSCVYAVLSLLIIESRKFVVRFWYCSLIWLLSFFLVAIFAFAPLYVSGIFAICCLAPCSLPSYHLDIWWTGAHLLLTQEILLYWLLLVCHITLDVLPWVACDPVASSYL